MTDNTAIAQRSQRKLRFNHRDMDFYFSWISGRAIYDGCDPVESERAVGAIRDGDVLSWQHAWTELGIQVEQIAKNMAEMGQMDDARRAYLRACTYHRAPLFMMSNSAPAFERQTLAMRLAYQQAAMRHQPLIEPVGISFRMGHLDGYFQPADRSGARRPLLVVVGGIETFAEDCMFMLGDAPARRGYHLLAIDLPGQGLTPSKGLHFEARMGPAFSAVLDYACSREDVDTRHIAAYGFSWGGHVVLKGALHEQQHANRLHAVIANPAMPDVFRAALAQQANHGRGDAIGRQVIEQIAWRMGLRISLRPADAFKRMAKAFDYLTHGRADMRQLRLPVLCLAGEAEAPITLRIAEACKRQFVHPQSTVRIFTDAEGGAAHCQVDNLALPNATLFDWLNTLTNPS